MNLSELKAGGFLVPEKGEVLASAVLENERNAETETPWIAKIALGLGAWLAGIFFTGFVVLLFDLNDQLPIAIIGFLIVSGSVVLVRIKRGVFPVQLALALGLSGYVLFCVGTSDLHRNDLVGPFLGTLILCGPVYYLCQNEVQRFFAVAWVWLTGWVASLEGPQVSLVALYLVSFAALAVAMLVLSGSRRAASSLWRPAMWASLVALFIMLFWVSLENYGRLNRDEVGPVLGLGTALAMSGAFWYLLQPRGALAVGGASAFAAILVGVGIAGAPGVVFGLGLMAIAHARRDRILGWAAVLALGYFLILFYYHLDLSLVRKSIILMVTGVVFLALRLGLFRGVPDAFSAPVKTAVASSRSRWIQSAAIFANGVLVLAVVNFAIVKKQQVVDTGRTVFLQLAPVDPRSLMQGDYMTLNYALPQESKFKGSMMEASTRGRLLLRLDERDIGKFSRLGGEGVEPEEREVPLKYRKWRRGWRFGIESFFFQEGLGSRYDDARFAELRVSPYGEAVLVDLRGEDLAELTGDKPDEPGAP